MIHLGIDVAKDELVIFDGCSVTSIANSPASIRVWLKKLPQDAVLACESTGIYSYELATASTESGHLFFMLQPSWVKASGRAKGQRSKTDRVDSMLIRQYLLDHQANLHPFKLMNEDLAQLRTLFRFRQKEARDLAGKRTQVKALGIPESIAKMVLDGPVAALKALDGLMSELLAKMARSACLQTIPGLGLQGATACYCALEHIPFASADAFVAYAGLDPAARESGTARAQRHISKKGDASLRTALYMCGLAATRHSHWKPTYDKLKERLSPRAAIIAIARRIAKLAFTLHRKQERFVPNAS